LFSLDNLIIISINNY